MPRLIPSVRGCFALGVWILASAHAMAAEPAANRIEFNRDIRPILSDTCYHCHGPDQAKRKANLRLDTEDGAFAARDGRPALVPGNLAKSTLYQRITATDPVERMPPPDSGRKLTAAQIDLLRRWIEQGAKWQPHWSFIPPRRPELPGIQQRDWPRNPIDHFVLARLERERLRPTPEAERTTLVRRVTLDLTGLPPTPAEVETACQDPSKDWYEKVVDRLLQSPRHGERMAARWLDAARYADTNGYQNDGERVMWRWRDWVIDAFNHNMPFDQFTIEQLAGDLLPNPTLEQRIATGFNRNHRGNSEGGIVPEEYAVEYVADRVETTATVWLGLTLTCSRCHDHKYDPVKQKEFYQLFAFFNNVPEKGKAIKFGNSPPYLKAPTAAQQEQMRHLDARIQAMAEAFARHGPELDRAEASWVRALPSTPPIQWSITDGLLAHYPLDGDASEASGKKGQFTAGSPTFVPGRLGQAADFDGQRFIDAGDVADFGFYDHFTLSAWVYPRDKGDGTILARMTDTARAEGYGVRMKAGKVQVNLVKRWLDDAIRVETESRLTPDRWHHVAVTYDGSRLARGVQVYLDGQPAKLRVLLDDLNQSFRSKEPLRIGSDGGSDSRFHGAIDEVRIYQRDLSADEVAVLATADSVTDIAKRLAGKRTAEQRLKLRAYFLEQHAPEPIRALDRQLVELRRQRARLFENIPTTMVMEEMPTPRDAFVLIRGVYDKRGERVSPSVPSCLPPMPTGTPINRLGLARWLVDPSHPLTARVAVNRVWQMYFGTGLVKTVDDFGAQGEWPSYPELLDWLATEFIRTGWDLKRLHRTIVTSATYRQSSRLTPELVQKDPENRLLARGPRYRLSAEMLRDQALAVSGLLVERLGGPSVKPYQPPGLWKELTGGIDYQPDHGPNLYRRSLYTFWKRTAAPPMMMTFDAAGRETCIVRESRTNTPLQALNLMNDVTYVEAARNLAQRVLTEAGPNPAERLTLAVRLATARRPTAAELKVLLGGLDRHLAVYRHERQAALQLVAMGETPRDPRLDVGELAAYTAMAGLILNLDETVTKE